MRRMTIPLAALCASLTLLGGCSGTPLTPVSSASPTTAATQSASASPAASEAASAAETPATSEAPAASEAPTQGALVACAELGQVMMDFSSTLQGATGGSAKNAKSAVKKLKDFSVEFAAAVDKVTNPEVKAQAQKARKSLDKLVDELTKALDNPAKANAKKMTKAMTTMQKEFTAMGKVCG